MTTKLYRRARRTSEHPLLASMRALRAVLDSVEANIFVADLSFQLVYANRCAMRTAAIIEPQLRSSFGVDVADLLFGSIHRFHKDPARIEAILRNPAKFPHQATFAFGEVALANTINGVYDDDGALLGYCVAWDEVSEQRRIEETVRGLADDLAGASVQLSELATGSVQAITELINRISDGQSSIADAVEEQSATTSEISSTVHHVAGAATTSTGAVASLTTAAHEVATKAHELRQLVAEK